MRKLPWIAVGGLILLGASHYRLDIADIAEYCACSILPLENRRLQSSAYKEALESLNPSTYGKVLFLGDSLTWNLDTEGIIEDSINMGIKGDTTAGLLGRISAISGQFPVVFVMIGTNDLRFRSNAGIATNISRIADELGKSGNLGKVILQSILPVQSGRRISNRRIVNINENIKEICARGGMQYLDLYESFIDPATKGIGTELTTDGTHLSPAGNKTWASIVADYLRSM